MSQQVPRPTVGGQPCVQAIHPPREVQRSWGKFEAQCYLGCTGSWTSYICFKWERREILAAAGLEWLSVDL